MNDDFKKPSLHFANHITAALRITHKIKTQNQKTKANQNGTMVVLPLTQKSLKAMWCCLASGSAA
jgi:hypothetical protein